MDGIEQDFGANTQADGTVISWWGDSAYGEILIATPADLAGVIAISCGEYHSLALKADGSVVAWGDNGRVHVPSHLTDVIAIAAGAYHSLALKADGTVFAWGRESDSLQNFVPAGLTGVVAISAGLNLSQALKSDGTVVALGATAPRTVHTNVVAISAAQSLALIRFPAATIIGTTGQPLSVPYAPAVALAQFVATGLPPGLTIHPGTGFISGTSAQSGTWTATITMSNLAQTRQESQSFTITAGPTAPERTAAYTAWVAANWPSGGPDRLPGADPDFDDVNNMLEYAMGTDPLIMGAPSPLVYSQDTTGRLVLTLHVVKDRAAYVTYEAQFSDTLDFSEPATIAPQTVFGTPGDMIQLRFTDPQINSRHRFGRLSTTVP